MMKTVIILLMDFAIFFNPGITMHRPSVIKLLRTCSFGCVSPPSVNEDREDGPWSSTSGNIGAFSVRGAFGEWEDRYKIVDGYAISGFAVFDGHNGAVMAQYAADHLLDLIIEKFHENEDSTDLAKNTRIIYDAFVEVDENGKKRRSVGTSGTTALVGLLHGANFYIANVGDSRAVAKLHDSEKPAQISIDQTPNTPRERARLNAACGNPNFGAVWQGDGSYTRSIGDVDFKPGNESWLIASPETCIIDLTKHAIEYVILATDGVWEVLGNEQAVNIVSAHLNSDELFGAKQLVEAAQREGSKDDITAMVVKLDQRYFHQ